MLSFESAIHSERMVGKAIMITNGWIINYFLDVEDEIIFVYSKSLYIKCQMVFSTTLTLTYF